ncbi:MAG: hypothetical protein JXR03_16440 [Cyclobacteriaceae bacterium]
MLFEPYKKYPSGYLKFDFVNQPWQEKSYWKLRKEVFCDEQKLFKDTDRDLSDLNAIHIISNCYCMGMEDQAVGVVRIFEREPGVWFGGRLAVHKNYRTASRFKTLNLFPENESIHPFTLSVGGALIYKAVSSAVALGCHEFLAHVQYQNVRFFERMHWRVTDTIEKNGLKHAVMQADLSFYKLAHSCPQRLRSA